MTTTMHTTISIPDLRAELAGEVIGPDDPTYDAARRVFSSMVDRRPAVIARPRDADGVAHVVSLARETGLELAVRGGGHSVAGHGVSEGGIVLDLSLMKALQVDASNGVAWAEAGLTAGEVTAMTGALDLVVGFGDTGSVGIGGLTLGGGMGYLVRKHGLTIDHLLAAEIVTAGGEVLRVDADEHPDLFWAIRGGGGNFGVATRFCYRLHHLAIATGGMLILPAAPETITAFAAAAEEAPDEVSTIASVLSAAPPMPFIPVAHQGSPVMLATLVFAGAGEAADRALAPFRALGPMVDMIGPRPYHAIFPPEEPEHAPPGTVRTEFLDRIDRPVAEAIVGHLRASTAQVAAAQIRVLGGAMARVPADATAFAHRSSRIMVNVGAMFASREEAPVHEAWTIDTAAALRQSDGGAFVSFLGDEGAERVRQAYPAGTWARLTAVKGRYDPENLFRLNQNVPPSEPGSSR